MATTSPERNKALLLKAFDTLFNKRDYAAAEGFWYWSETRNPRRRRLRGRFSGHGRPRSWIAADIVRFEDGKLAEHWDVLQDEATKVESLSGLPMFGDRFPA
jgi:hypothetical protein